MHAILQNINAVIQCFSVFIVMGKKKKKKKKPEQILILKNDLALEVVG